MGELHLDIIVDRMKREFKKAKWVLKWLIEKQYLVHQSYIHKKQSGGSGQFAVTLSVEPLEPGREVDNKIKAHCLSEKESVADISWFSSYYSNPRWFIMMD